MHVLYAVCQLQSLDKISFSCDPSISVFPDIELYILRVSHFGVRFYAYVGAVSTVQYI